LSLAERRMEMKITRLTVVRRNTDHPDSAKWSRDWLGYVRANLVFEGGHQVIGLEWAVLRSRDGSLRLSFRRSGQYGPVPSRSITMAVERAVNLVWQSATAGLRESQKLVGVFNGPALRALLKNSR